MPQPGKYLYYPREYKIRVTWRFRPSVRRIVKGRDDYEPTVLGNPDHPVVVQMFADPFTETARTFFRDVYDGFKEQYLSSDANVRFELRPVAPEMRTAISATAFDARRVIARGYSPDARVDATDVAECAHAVRERGNDAAFTYLVSRACRLADNTELTYAQLRKFIEAVDTDVDPDAVFEDMACGRYRHRVREDSEQWFRRLPSTGTMERDRGQAPTEVAVFVNGEAITEMTYEGLSDQIKMVSTLIVADELETGPDAAESTDDDGQYDGERGMSRESGDET